ncbi:MAG TPA: GlsB/YeaQ/YmgE family stress response membrane protein [Nocardioidaceae bacterium]|nr:GlsB/YeaQ/YmgE family stress response membrane protein [Nocardioidaceae bacterium]
MEIVVLIIAGAIIGLLGKWVAPGSRDNTGILVTILCGIAGVIVGWFIAKAFGVAATSGIDWLRWIISVIVAAAFVAVASTLTGKSRSRMRL